MSVVACNQVSKTFAGNRVVLEGIEFGMEEGELVMISGPPGAGKSTLLSILEGYMLPTEGSVALFGRKVSEMSSHQRAKFRREELGVVFQQGRLIPSLTVLDNVVTPLICGKDCSKNVYMKGLQILNYMGIDKKADYSLDKLSGAERQLVAISRALVNQPRLVFLDEPTQFFDHGTGVKVMTYLRQMVLDHQMSVICVMSDVRLFPFASKVIRMRGGKIFDILGDSLIDAPFLKV